jgi:hydrogenase maturation protein HypF
VNGIPEDHPLKSKTSGEKHRAVDAVVFGVVQGVGFRPFVFRTARKLGYKGWVKNVGSGVEIHLESGDTTDFTDFFSEMENQLPPLARIERIDVREADNRLCPDFSIQATREGGSFVFISPDIAMCENCRREMRLPGDRRHRYPFINCTDCGPRYTIVEHLPYDRKWTTMADFAMCPDCRREYTDPMDRRYHAQPIACPVCGPRVQMLEAGHPVEGGIERARDLIRSGEIVAVKGLGGFHLMCDPHNTEAVARLRALKARRFKPLALMARDMDEVTLYADPRPAERELLLSPQRPIVLLRTRREIPGIAPGLGETGFMLPSTPLHDLLLEDIPLVVATSSNFKDAPIIRDETEGIHQLSRSILTHDRPIHMRADDSVLKVAGGAPVFLRRARGYVPYPQAVPDPLRFPGHILALGAELKNTISIYKNGYVVTSQFLGDLDDYRNLAYFEETVAHLTRLFEVTPAAVVSDLHPDFHSTRKARSMGIRHLRIQHHHAHILAALLEHGEPPGTPALGVVLDGYGYGADGGAWGGEFLLAGYAGSRRFAHFETLPLPGGDLAARQPWRMAVAYLERFLPEALADLPALAKIEPNKIRGVREMMARGLNCPPTSSCGRLFDAVSFLSGLAPEEIEFEAQAPMLLEAAAAESSEERPVPYPFRPIERPSGETAGPKMEPSVQTVGFGPTIAAVIEDLRKGTPASRIAARFHHTLVEAVASVALYARRREGTDTVVLAGGVFLNRVLLEAAGKRLIREGFRVLRPQRYSPNDESISVGQIAGALYQLKDQS